MRRVPLLVGLLLFAGCAPSEPGTPAAASRPTSTTTTPTTPTTTSDARPRDVDLGAVDVCAVVGALPRASFGLDERAPLAGTSSIFPGAADCFANGAAANLSLTLVAVTDQGAGDFAEGANAEVDRLDVHGYPFYVLTPADAGSCFGALDASDGQMLFISYGLASPGSDPVTSQVTLCERVYDIASAAISHL